ncbi:MAG: arylamine N-acetyltransferase, partial [Phycisphaerales bacterium]|nr:arylamine N-acetyltransferase [Phycisphaerales bacterium]
MDRPPRPDLAALGVLQQAFLLAVPFENLDIHIGRHIDFDTASVYRKIVTERRGGFCYECNGMFHDLLAALGYRAGFASARMTI